MKHIRINYVLRAHYFFNIHNFKRSKTHTHIYTHIFASVLSLLTYIYCYQLIK